MTIKNNSGWTFYIKGAIDKVTDKAIEGLKEYTINIYWNDLECYHWIFNFKLDNIWFENAEINCDDLEMTLYVY